MCSRDRVFIAHPELSEFLLLAFTSCTKNCVKCCKSRHVLCPHGAFHLVEQTDMGQIAPQPIKCNCHGNCDAMEAMGAMILGKQEM